MSKIKYLVEAETPSRIYYYGFLAKNSEDAIKQFLKKKNARREFFSSIKSVEIKL